MGSTEDRASELVDDAERARAPRLSAEEAASREAENALRQADRMFEMIEHSLSSKRFRLRPSTIIELNRFAVDGLVARPGAYRVGKILISNSEHAPPAHDDVPRHIDDMCDYVSEAWDASYAIHLASYILWRSNWIHAFDDGNGRTSRAVSYLILCVKSGYLLPGTRSIPELIAANKTPYYDALEAADRAWKQGKLDLSRMESLLKSLLAQQLLSVVLDAAGPLHETAGGGQEAETVAPEGIAPAAAIGTPAIHGSSPPKAAAKPRLFIGSSAEGLAVAEALQVALEYDADVTIWSQGVFGLASGTLETLSEKASEFDFAALILGPDDLLVKRKDGKPSARDNVLLELGLFIGRLGRLRTFVVHPRTNMHMPSDLAGVTPATYDPSRRDGNLQAALGPAATQIKRAVQDQGIRIQTGKGGNGG